jgi:DNA-binding response OmpR family regulator
MSGYILIVENEADIADVMRRYLEFEGYRIHCVVSCEDARVACAAGLPDLIVLDWHLPDMEGDEWVEELRAHGATASIPIIMMTGGYPTPTLLLQLKAAQIPLLIKPFSLEQLVESIKQMTNRERAIGATPLGVYPRPLANAGVTAA